MNAGQEGGGRMKPTRHGMKHVREDCPRDFSGLRCRRARARVPHGIDTCMCARVSVGVVHYFRSGGQRVLSGTLIDYKFNALPFSSSALIRLSRERPLVRGYSRQKQRIHR